jgi:tumor protein p53-inducible protein 3
MKVEAFAINRADILQRKGKYPPPHGVTSILGLECSGYLVDNKGKVDTSKKYMALLSGGAYAEYVAVNRNHVIEIPENIDMVKAAAIPEAWITAYGLCKLAGIKPNDHCLIHAAASGVGTALIQLVNFFKAKSICLVSNEKKATFCYELGQGSVSCVERGHKDKVKNILHHSESRGCDIIFDCVGGDEFINVNKNLF